jgi:hypothetical protein
MTVGNPAYTLSFHSLDGGCVTNPKLWIIRKPIRLEFVIDLLIPALCFYMGMSIAVHLL